MYRAFSLVSAAALVAAILFLREPKDGRQV
jgi:hypothetical protein